MDQLKLALINMKISKRQRAKFAKKLGAVIQKVEKLLKSISGLTADTGCFAQKAIVNSVLASSDKKFESLFEQFNKVKEECKSKGKLKLILNMFFIISIL